MNRPESFDATLADWLDGEAQRIAPAGLHEGAMRAAGSVRQRPTWLVALRGGVDAAPRAARGAVVARRHALVALAVLLLAAVVVVVGALRNQPDPLLGVTNGRIMFARERLGAESEEKAQYVTVRPDGTDEVPFMEADDCGQCTFWSPDSRRILVPSVADPERLGTAIIDPDGSREVVVPFPDATLYLGPGGWLPDGRIVLEGFDPNDPSRPEVGLYIANPDGSGLRQVTSSNDGRMHVFPTVSPDGEQIVFVAQDPEAPAVGAFSGDLFVVGVDGTDLRQVNPSGTKVIVSAVTGRPADWSPDGRALAYAATLGSLDAGRSAVFVVSAAGGEPEQISAFGTSILSVDWSPNGTWLAYWEGNVPDPSLSTWIATPDGTTVRQVMGPGTALQGCCATWSPDSTLLLVQRSGVGGGDLWTMDLDGNLVDRITTDPGSYIWYSWAREP